MPGFYQPYLRTSPSQSCPLGQFPAMEQGAGDPLPSDKPWILTRLTPLWSGFPDLSPILDHFQEIISVLVRFCCKSLFVLLKRMLLYEACQ